MQDYRNEYGLMPTYDTMMEGIGTKSKSGIHRFILCLEERGYITRLPNKARAIEIIKEI